MWHRYSLSSFCSALWDSWASGSLKKKLKPAFGQWSQRNDEIAARVQAFGSRGWRRKKCPGARRQQGRRQLGKNRPVLALADGETRRCREQSANKGAASPGKSWACWRWRTEKQSFPRSEAPTKAPLAREKAARVGVGGRRNKASRGARRQQGRRQPGKKLGLLA